MRSLKLILFCILVCGAALVRAENFELLDGRTITGELLASSATDVGIQIKTGEGVYEKFTWAEFSQSALKELGQKPKLGPFVEPFIEIPLEQRLRKTEVVIKPVPHLDLPASGSLLGGLFGSSVGLVILLLLYGANLYAGYEIATLRAYPPAMVCGISAVAPIVGPVVFLCLPTKMDQPAQAEPAHAPAEVLATSSFAGDPNAAQHPTGMHFADQTPAPAAALPELQVFQRGQFTFNRRFIETKFGGFFGVIRPEADKDMQLLVKGSHGEINVHRINRISANDMHVEIHKGTTVAELVVTFGEIQEMKLKHKDAK